MLKLGTKNKKDFVLKAEWKAKKQTKDVVCEKNYVTDFLHSKSSYAFVGDVKKFTSDSLKAVAVSVFGAKRGYQVDIKSFVTKDVSEKEVVRVFTEAYFYMHGEVFTLKTAKKPKLKNFTLLNTTSKGKSQFKTSKQEAQVRNWSRSLQVMPPNHLNSVNYATKLKKEFSKLKNVKVKVLARKEIEKLKMGLLLGVNAGSMHDPRLVVLEYKGKPKSKDKTVYVGKGIMFDSGGYSLKPSNYMKTMKFDMSGTAVVAGAMKLIALNKPKVNISAVLPLTDNLIGPKAQTVDSVQKSMSGKTVEINNTDAEGRLVLADALTYAVKNLKATRIVDVATLTGAMAIALDKTYTGIWTTSDKDFKLMAKAAKTKGEKIWRMPFHDDYLAGFKKSKVADLLNTNYDSKAGSSSAAMFLKEFTEKIPYIHFDIAGTDQHGGVPTGVLVKTLAEFANLVK